MRCDWSYQPSEAASSAHLTVSPNVETVEQSAQPQDSQDSRAQPDHPSELVVEPGVRGADLDHDVADLSGRVGFDARDGVVHSVVGRVQLRRARW